MNSFKVLIIFILTILCTSLSFGQEKMFLSLKESINLGQQNSPQAKAAKISLTRSYWQNVGYKSRFLPTINLDGTLPQFASSFERVVQPDGQEKFVNRSLSNSQVGININQPISATGTSLFFNSNIQRIDILSDPTSTSYLLTPVSFGIQQPLFQFNSLKWLQKIEPLRYELAFKSFNIEMEQIAQNIVNQFFDVYTAQASLDIAQKNLKNSDALYKISEKRYDMGKIAENDLLQLELAKLNAEIAYEQALQNLQTFTFIFKMSIGAMGNQDIDLILPKVDFVNEVRIDTAMQLANENSAINLQNRISLLELEQRLAQVKGETGLRANIFAQVGVNSTPSNLTNPLDGSQQTQNARFGFQMPILDWGSTKSRLKIAKSDYALQYQQVEVSLINQQQRVVEAVYRFNINIKQQKISSKADTVGQKRYFIAKQRYLLGKISITDLNLAQLERDNAELANLSIQRAYWNSLYELRKLCLYDFERRKNIDYVDKENYIPLGL